MEVILGYLISELGGIFWVLLCLGGLGGVGVIGQIVLVKGWYWHMTGSVM